MTRLNTIPSDIIPGFNPDPTVIRVGEDYFLATSTFEYFPGVPIYHSKDLVNWRIIGHALNRRSQLDMRRVDPGGGIYAPTLRYHKGKFYMATTCVYSRQGLLLNETRGFYVSTDNIWDETAWSDPVYFDMVGIDQDMFFDDDDRVYLTVSRLFPFRFGPGDPPPSAVIFGCEIDLETGASLSRPVILAKSTTTVCAEGPHIVKRAGWYYLIVAEGGCDEFHQVRVSRSKSPLGLYEYPKDEKINPVVFNHLDPKLQCTGHADFVQDTKGNWWAYFLGKRPKAEGLVVLGRECFMAPMEWPEGGWPVVNGANKVELEFETALLPAFTHPKVWRDDFASKTLEQGWYHVRTPIKIDHSLTKRPGQLAIKGNAWSTRDVECPALLVRRQTSHDCTWTTELEFDPSTKNEEAGTTAYWSCFAYAAMIVRKADEGEGRVIVLEWVDEDKKEVEVGSCGVRLDPSQYQFKEIVHPISASGTIKLAIRCISGGAFTFSYQLEGADRPVELGSVSAKVLDNERKPNSPYTGAMFGLFAQGRLGFPCEDWAYFKYAECERHD